MSALVFSARFLCSSSLRLPVSLVRRGGLFEVVVVVVVVAAA
jgi:hypothetical protein